MSLSTTTFAVSLILLGCNCLALSSAAARDKGTKAAMKNHPLPEGIRHLHTLGLVHAVNKTGALLQDGNNLRKERLQKRYLNWKNNQVISTTKDPVTVNYLRLHERSERVNINEDYVGFTLYKRNGTEVETNTGIFHFVKSSDSDEKRWQCRRRSLHAGAYRYIYGNCPEDDFDLVASGYCYRTGGRGLVYNSATFNGIYSYSDESYYENTNRRVNDIEITYFEKCFNEWKDGGFQRTFKCTVSPSFHVYQPNGTVYSQRVSNTLSSDACGDCEQDCNSNVRLIVPFYVIFVSVVFEALVSTG